MVCRTLEEADQAVRLCLEDGVFGPAGRVVVIEEFMEGEEASFFVMADGTHALPLVAWHVEVLVWASTFPKS